MRLNLFRILFVVLALLVFGNMSYAQDCKNGKCQVPGKGVVVQSGFKSVGPACQGNSCQLGASQAQVKTTIFGRVKSDRPGLLGRLFGRCR
jgi:hypothetical protein